MGIWNRNFWGTLAGAAALILLGYLCQEAWAGLFEVRDPTRFAKLYSTWMLLAYIVPGLVIGLIVNRKVIRSTLVAYAIGFIVLTHWQNVLAFSHSYTWLQTWLQIARSALHEYAKPLLIGLLIALVASYIRRRLTIGSSDRGAASSVNQGVDR